MPTFTSCLHGVYHTMNDPRAFPFLATSLLSSQKRTRKQTDKEKAGRLRNKTTFSSAGSPSILRRCFQTVCDSCLDIGYVAILYV